METQRTPSAPQRSGTHEAHAARHADKSGKATKANAKATDDDGTTTTAAQATGAFSQLLASLGMSADGLADALDTGTDAALGALGAGVDAGAALGQTPLQLVPGALSGLDAMWARGQGKAGMDSLVGQTARLDGAADTAAVNGTGLGATSAPVRGTAGRFPAAWAGAAGSTAAGGAGAAGAGQAAGSDAAGSLQGAAGGEHGKATAQSALAALTAQGSAAAAGAQPEHRDTAALGGGASAHRGAVESAPAALPPALMAQAPDAAQAEGRAGSRGGEGTAQGNGTMAAVPASEASRDTAGATFNADLSGAGSADAAQRAAEDQITEQLAYWVHQKTQNAELTLDRDGQPVQVTVSLTGSEAHVAFRSDQIQTREMLDGSVAQLRELMQAEGLQLSGVTVGTSGDSSGRDGRSGSEGGDRGRQGARQASVQAAVPLGAGMRAARGGSASSSLDVFV